ncbi:hypothetical protein GALMADRAFT_124540 [Galerina marginata CBS 339.88]|uniref:Protein CMS1 n=1 Tax=Galerina marginata (strain CBS 339.88) TaxID=685588 RepID=A0A067T389_GALM3|nr:hypothetical protein GALMADRAFT_124540 [Galerina marginata CBS 339.88]
MKMSSLTTTASRRVKTRKTRTKKEMGQVSKADSNLAKKRKRREKVKERKAKKRKLAEAAEPIPGSIAAQMPHALANYLVSMQVKSFPNLSALELDDLRIPESAIAQTTIWTDPRSLDQLVDFIMKSLPSLRLRLSQRSKSNGAPTLLYIAGAALRVADVTRVLKNKTLQGDKGGDVAKLFAKHFKLAQHVTYLKRTKIGAAVGTPGRLGKLLNETDALNVSALSHIILDITYKDAKNRKFFFGRDDDSCRQNQRYFLIFHFVRLKSLFV